MKEKIYVYIAPVEDFAENDILPQFAQKEIEKISNQKVIKQKKAVYGLLYKAVKDIFGFDDDFSHLQKNKNGKPFSDKYFLSISHSKEVVAVAVSSQNVGIDIEKIVEKNVVKLSSQIAHSEENISSIEGLYQAWVKKEAKFKYDGGEKFLPKTINTLSYASKVFTVKNQNDIYCLAVVADNIENIEMKNLIK